MNPKSYLGYGQFMCSLRKFWFPGSSWSVVDPCTDQYEPHCRRVFSCFSAPDSTVFILMHTFWSPLQQGCGSGGRVAEARLCLSDSSLLCPLLCQSLSALWSLFPALSFCPLSMIWWALHCSVLMVCLGCVCACLPFNFVWCTWVCALSHNFLNEDFVNTVL